MWSIDLCKKSTTLNGQNAYAIIGNKTLSIAGAQRSAHASNINLAVLSFLPNYSKSITNFTQKIRMV